MHTVQTQFGAGWSYRRYAFISRAAIAWDVLLPPRNPAAFGVLSYHRVADRRGGPPLTVSPARFRQQLRGLLRRGFQPFPLSRLAQLHVAGATIPPRTFAVVFDDGYQGVFTQAFPVLRRLRVPATVFLATAFLNRPAPFPFDAWGLAAHQRASADSWRPLTRQACRTMRDSGWIELGSHTHTHQDFCGRPQAFADDLRQSLLVLNALGESAPAMSFPYGRLDAGLVQEARAAGVACCLNSDCQLVEPHTALAGWGRFGAEQYDSPATLSAKLHGWYSFNQNLWRRIKNGRGKEAA